MHDFHMIYKLFDSSYALSSMLSIKKSKFTWTVNSPFGKIVISEGNYEGKMHLDEEKYLKN